MRRRRFTILDEEAESHDELIVNNANEEGEYFDFRNYPLFINWKDMDSIHNDSYEINEEFGFFGVSIYCRIQNDELLSKKIKIINFSIDS